MENLTKVLSILAIWSILIFAPQSIRGYLFLSGKPIVLKAKIGVINDGGILGRRKYVVEIDINTIDPKQVTAEIDSTQHGSIVYVQLETGEEYAQPILVSKKNNNNGLYLKGRAFLTYDKKWKMNYGIHEYYGEVEKFTPTHYASKTSYDYDVLVKVDRFGNGIIYSVVPSENT